MSDFIGIMNNNQICVQEIQPNTEHCMTVDVYMMANNDDDLAHHKHVSPTHVDDRYIVCFNGTLYNEMSLWHTLNKTPSYTKHTTIQLLVNLFKSKGTRMFSLLRGKFAILIWDKINKKLYGARDHFGIKTLYVLDDTTECIVSNEKKYMTKRYAKHLINHEALHHYLSFQYVPQPLTLTENINELKPGHYFIKHHNEPMIVKRYFHATFDPDLSLQTSDAIDNIREALWQAVKMQLPTDIPVGSFLSGGIDSSLLIAMAKHIRPDIKAISVGFSEQGFSELDIAKRTANTIEVDHITHIITPEEYVTVLPKIVQHMRDPLADPSCVPLYIAAREAKKHVDVILSGEGADEIFAGYNIYREFESLKYMEYLPQVLLNACRQLAMIIPEGVKGKSFLHRATTPLAQRYIGNAKIFEDREKMNVLNTHNAKYTYEQCTQSFYKHVHDAHPVEQMQYIDLNLWLPGNILPKAEQMTMAQGLDIRMPFLDLDVFQIARHLPVTLKITNRTTKAILRHVAKGWAPDHVITQQKLGFPVPLKHWLKNELYDWALSLIRKSQTDHLIHKPYILQLLNKHRRSHIDYSRKLWTILMFMIWHEMYMERHIEVTEEKVPNLAEYQMKQPSI